MNLFLRGLVRAVAETFALPGPILEVGSYRVRGQEDLADLRCFFPGREYVGLDVRPGPGVDVIGDVEELPYPDGSVGTVLALSTFEHVRQFWRGFAEVRRILRPDGALLVACPFYFHIHEHPGDFWRFTPSALEMLLEPYPAKVLGWHGPETRPANVWALAFREGRGLITADEYAHYQARMSAYARMPLPRLRRLRYLLGRVLCGRRPFAPYLDRERWQTRCLNRRGTKPDAAGAKRKRSVLQSATPVRSA
jgi:SAM-dependent methyltransferase